jgi:hypothetical protein
MCTPFAPARPLCGLLAGAGLLVYITGAGPPLNTSPGGRVMPDIRDGREGHAGRGLWRTLEIEFICLKQCLMLIASQVHLVISSVHQRISTIFFFLVKA